MTGALCHYSKKDLSCQVCVKSISHIVPESGMKQILIWWPLSHMPWIGKHLSHDISLSCTLSTRGCINKSPVYVLSTWHTQPHTQTHKQAHQQERQRERETGREWTEWQSDSSVCHQNPVNLIAGFVLSSNELVSSRGRWAWDASMTAVANT